MGEPLSPKWELPFLSPFSFHGEPQAVFRRKKEAAVGEIKSFFGAFMLVKRISFKGMNLQVIHFKSENIFFIF